MQQLVTILDILWINWDRFGHCCHLNNLIRENCLETSGPLGKSKITLLMGSKLRWMKECRWMLIQKRQELCTGEALKIGRSDYVLSKDNSWRVLKIPTKTKEYLDYLKYCGPEWSWNRIIADSGWTGEEYSGYPPTVDQVIWKVIKILTPPDLFYQSCWYQP